MCECNNWICIYSWLCCSCIEILIWRTQRANTNKRGVLSLMLQFVFIPPFWLARACTSMHVQSVICSHTCVSQRLHPPAPLACCHGELPLAYSKCIGVCVHACLFMCATSCFAFAECVCIRARVCSCMHACMETSVHAFRWKCFCDLLCVRTCAWCTCVCAQRACQACFTGCRSPLQSTLRQMREQGYDDSESVGGRGPRPLSVRLFVVHIPLSCSLARLKLFLFWHFTRKNHWWSLLKQNLNIATIHGWQYQQQVVE